MGTTPYDLASHNPCCDKSLELRGHFGYNRLCCERSKGLQSRDCGERCGLTRIRSSSDYDEAEKPDRRPPLASAIPADPTEFVSGRGGALSVSA
jgi:hypothetical protein